MRPTTIQRERGNRDGPEGPARFEGDGFGVEDVEGGGFEAGAGFLEGDTALEFLQAGRKTER
jgi:hypothetical protein